MKKLYDWAKAEAQKADASAHDMSDGTTPAADHRRTLAWTRAQAFYDVMREIETSHEPKLDREWRIVELRPEVFSVEARKRGLFGWGSWTAQQCYRVPSVPEYSPLDVMEFTREAAEAFVEEQRQRYTTEALRLNPPPGFPKVV